MAFNDVVAFLGLLVAVAAFGLQAMVARRDHRRDAQEQSARVTPPSPAPSQVSASSDRELITFVVRNRDKPGTLEYVLSDFQRRARALDDPRFLGSPELWREMPRSDKGMIKFFGGLMLVWLLLALTSTWFSHDLQTATKLLVTAVGIVAGLVMVLTTKVLLKRRDEAIQAADAYIEFLREWRITLGMEMTQPREMREQMLKALAGAMPVTHAAGAPVNSLEPAAA